MKKRRQNKQPIEQKENTIMEATGMTPKAGALSSLGYIAFLRGDFEATRSLLAESYALGGEDWRREELDDICLFPLPQDGAFVDMLKSLDVIVG
jgi:hypothetical protein